MTKKGKFKLLSYFIDDYLIYYKSCNKNEKIIAFSLILIDSISSIFSILKNFLSLRFLNYFSFQIQNQNNTLLILSFEDYSQTKILRYFNTVYEELTSLGSLEFLKNEPLEKEFLNSLIKDFNSKISLKEFSDSLLLKNKRFSRKLYLYNINLDLLKKKKEFFLRSILNFSKNLDFKGIFIFHFNIDKNNQIILYPYLIELINEEKNKPLYESEINNFYNSKLLEKEPLKIKDFGFILWRLPIGSTYYYLKDYSIIFDNNNKSIDIDLLIKKTLAKNNIKFLKINDKMLLIKNKVLFIYLVEVNILFIKKIIEKYYKNYKILILIINSNEYESLINNIRNLNSLKNLKIVHLGQFKKIINDLSNENHDVKKCQDQSQYLEQNNPDVV
jgi:hypothetical protein